MPCGWNGVAASFEPISTRGKIKKKHIHNTSSFGKLHIYRLNENTLKNDICACVSLTWKYHNNFFPLNDEKEIVVTNIRVAQVEKIAFYSLCSCVCSKIWKMIEKIK